jgi:hypothetical protein
VSGALARPAIRVDSGAAISPRHDAHPRYGPKRIEVAVERKHRQIVLESESGNQAVDRGSNGATGRPATTIQPCGMRVRLWIHRLDRAAASEKPTRIGRLDLVAAPLQYFLHNDSCDRERASFAQCEDERLIGGGSRAS